MSSFLHKFACTMLHTFFYDGKFYFWLRQLIAIPVWTQLWFDFQGGGVTTEARLPPKAVFQKRSSSTKGCPPLKVVFHGRLFSKEGCFPPKVVFHRRSSSIEGCLPPKVVFHWRSSSTEGCLPPMVVSHWFDLIWLIGFNLRLILFLVWHS